VVRDSIIAILFLLFGLVDASSAFELNFQPVTAPGMGADFPKGGYDNTGNPISCPDASNPDCYNGTGVSADQTRFYYERVDGYWHLIIGDPSVDSFVQETYIPTLSQFHSPSGGHEPVFFTLNGNLQEWSGNGWDPLEFENKTYGPENASFSGNGTGDPTRVVIRQILGTGSLAGGGGDIQEWTCAADQFCQEFLKAEAGFKPKITQRYTAPDLVINFVLDMSAISYSDMTTAATMINTVSVIDAGFPAPGEQFAPGPMVGGSGRDSANFDMATDAGTLDVTGGKYTYTPGSGWHDDGDGDVFRAYGPGFYDYVGVGVSDMHLQIEWSMYYDPAQNAAGSYVGNKALCDDLALAVCTAPPSGF
jgi:hypothetical protein